MQYRSDFIIGVISQYLRQKVAKRKGEEYDVEGEVKKD